MGLVSSLSNAVSGLRINQDSLTVVSRNIANAGTPGYHRQALNVIDHNDATSSYARSNGVQRAFDQSLQAYYTRQVSDTAYSNIQAQYLDQLQTFLGKPGSAGSLDKVYQDLENALRSLSTSPDDYAARAEAVAYAQAMAETLNRLSGNIQTMRQETESRIADTVHSLNGMLTSLEEVNLRLLDLGTDEGVRATLLDQRDRLVAGIAEKVDVQADYRSNGTVALMTRAGVGLLDNRASQFSFESAGNLAATSTFTLDADLTRVGKLTLTTPSGLVLDLVQQGILQGGELGGLVGLRDRTLVEAQSQLDEIAAALALAFGTEPRAGTPVAGGQALDLSGVMPGNEVAIEYTSGGALQRLRLVNTGEALDYKDATGARVIGIDLSADPADIALVLNGLGLGLNFSGAGAGLEVQSGAATLERLNGRFTASALQGGGAAMQLFVDLGNAAFTNDIDTDPPQKLGFAGRISINSAVLADNRLLVQQTAGGSLGESTRPDFFLARLASMQFVSGGDPRATPDRFQLSGNLSTMISQTIGFQGNSISLALARRDDRVLTLETITRQMEVEYGVDIDEEMARLIELQNAYAANARVVSVVKELLAELLRI